MDDCTRNRFAVPTSLRLARWTQSNLQNFINAAIGELKRTDDLDTLLVGIELVRSRNNLTRTIRRIEGGRRG